MNERFERLKTAIFAGLEVGQPRRTGTLLSSWERTTIDKGEQVRNTTPYMVYTHEHWVSPQWRGRENPNLKWVEKKIETVLESFSGSIGVGYVKEVITPFTYGG